MSYKSSLLFVYCVVPDDGSAPLYIHGISIYVVSDGETKTIIYIEPCCRFLGAITHFEHDFVQCSLKQAVGLSGGGSDRDKVSGFTEKRWQWPEQD
jgi:hypothetical protein